MTFSQETPLLSPTELLTDPLARGSVAFQAPLHKAAILPDLSQ